MKKIFRYVMIYISVTMIMIGLLSVVALIPRNMIEKNCQESADIKYNIVTDVHYMVEGMRTTYIDDYAELMLMNIAYHMDSQAPVRSAIAASHYYKNGNTVVSFHDAVYKDKAANTNYSRYWHGSLVYLRPLLVFFNIDEIHLVNIVVLSIFFGMFVYELIRKKEFLFLIAFVIGNVIVGIYTVPFCMEYMGPFVVMLLMGIGVLKLPNRYIFPMFFIGGMFVNYLDFLSSETLAFTIPAFLYVLRSYRLGYFQNTKDGLKWLIKAMVLWVAGYGGAYLAKWLLALIVEGPDDFIEALRQAARRGGGLATDSLAVQLIKAQFSPILYLLPYIWVHTYGDILIAIIGSVFVYCVIVVLYRKRSLENGLKKCMYLLAFIPYLRYFILNNHSYVHPFFVYRAQLITVMIILYFILWRIHFDKYLIKSMKIKTDDC